MPNTDPILDPEEFHKRRNNFALHFAGKPGEHLMGDIYRRQEHYQECMKAHPEEFGKLSAELYDVRDDNSPEYIDKLYEAYKMMHPYAQSDWVLRR